MITTLFTQTANESPVTFAQRIDALLFLLGPIGVSQLLMQHRDGANGQGLLYLTMIYAVGAGAPLRSVAFLGTATSTATAQANAFLVANPTYVPQRVFDIGSQNRRSLARDVVMLLYVDGALPACQSFQGLIPVQSLTAIAAGAAGQVWQLTAAGNKGPYAVINKQQGTWPAGGTGWAFADPLTCVLNGYPSCCAGTPATTTTTNTGSTTSSTSSTSSSSTTTTPPPEACGIWSIEANYDCDAEVWVVEPGPYSCASFGPCGTDIGWVNVPGTCTSQHLMYTVDCDTQPVPGSPSEPPDAACCTPCSDCTSAGPLSDGTNSAPFQFFTSNSSECVWTWFTHIDASDEDATYTLTYHIGTGMYSMTINLVSTVGPCTSTYSTADASGVSCASGAVVGSVLLLLDDCSCGGCDPSITVSF